MKKIGDIFITEACHIFLTCSSCDKGKYIGLQQLLTHLLRKHEVHVLCDDEEEFIREERNNGDDASTYRITATRKKTNEDIARTKPEVAEIFLTLERQLAFTCSVCVGSALSGFQELLAHFSREHAIYVLYEIENDNSTTCFETQPEVKKENTCIINSDGETENFIHFDECAIKVEFDSDVESFATNCPIMEIGAVDPSLSGTALDRRGEKEQLNTIDALVTISESKEKPEQGNSIELKQLVEQNPVKEATVEIRPLLTNNDDNTEDPIGGTAVQARRLRAESDANAEIADCDTEKTEKKFNFDEAVMQRPKRRCTLRQVKKYFDSIENDDHRIPSDESTLKRPSRKRKYVDPIKSDDDKIENDELKAINPSFICAECDRNFATANHRSKHMVQKHSDLQSSRCLICDKTFLSNNHLIRHFRLHSGEYKIKKKSLVIYPRRRAQKKLNGHMSNMESVSPSNEDYSGDNTTAKNKSALERDDTTSSNDERPFRCEICGSTYKKIRNLKEHLERHTQVKSLKCSRCPKLFSRHADLNIHERHHSDDRPYTCDECGWGFVTISHRTKHIKNVHTNRHHKCEKCKRVLASQKSLMRHYQTLHSSDHKRVCGICNMRSPSEEALRQHLRTHSKQMSKSTEKTKTVLHLKGKTYSIEKRQLVLHSKNEKTQSGLLQLQDIKFKQDSKFAEKFPPALPTFESHSKKKTKPNEKSQSALRQRKSKKETKPSAGSFECDKCRLEFTSRKKLCYHKWFTCTKKAQ